MVDYFDKKSCIITEGEFMKNFDDTYPNVYYTGWENIEPISEEELGDYLTWILNKRGYLSKHEVCLDLGPEYSYEQYLKEKNA